MEYRCKVTVIDKKLFPELQAQYCAVPDSGKCPCYNVAMSLFSIEMMKEMISGIVAQVP